MGFKQQAQNYYRLAKPGIIYANLLTAVAGYLFASQLHIKVPTFVGLIAGVSLIIAGACVLNNYLDQRIDALMPRTKQRALITGAIKRWQALVFASVLTMSGFIVVLGVQNGVTILLLAIAYIDYVVLYGYAKRHTVYSTHVGTISGAIPLVAGYTAVTGSLDVTAVLLFMLMTTWQMAHFFGIALFRQADYGAAHIPIMSVARGPRVTQQRTIIYMICFLISIMLLRVSASASWITCGILFVLGVIWLIKSIRSRSHIPPEKWGKQVFKFSLVIVLTLSVLLAFDSILV
jgi:protoheme IX farnesyltransferase